MNSLVEVQFTRLKRRRLNTFSTREDRVRSIKSLFAFQSSPSPYIAAEADVFKA
jgi:hypothetical protein